MTTTTENENITKPTLRRLTREEPPAVVDAWRSSGLSAAAFGATIGVSGQKNITGTLLEHYWTCYILT